MDIDKHIIRKILYQYLRKTTSFDNHPNSINITKANDEISKMDLRGRQDLLNIKSTKLNFSELNESNKQLTRIKQTNINEDMSQTTEEFVNQPSSISEEPSSSSYILASDRSIFSEQVDSWLRGDTVPTEHTGVQRSRVPLVQRSTVTTTSLNPLGANLWCMLAMLLPLCSINNYLQWSCSASDVINTAELCLANLSRIYGQIRNHMQRFAEDNLARDLFATLMDIVLVLYAIGFLFLSLYQAAVFR